VSRFAKKILFPKISNYISTNSELQNSDDPSCLVFRPGYEMEFFTGAGIVPEYRSRNRSGIGESSRQSRIPGRNRIFRNVDFHTLFLE
jgi:hypothetical protein